MHFVKSDHGQEKMSRRTMSRAMNLLLIASFIAAPTSIVLLPTLSFAAPLPVPSWIAKIIRGLKTGTLTEIDLKNLKDSGKGSFKNLISVVNRINQLAAYERAPLILDVHGIVSPTNRSKVGVRVSIVNPDDGRVIRTYYLGLFNDDYRGTTKDASTQAPMANVSE